MLAASVKNIAIARSASSQTCFRCRAGCKVSEPVAPCALNEPQTSRKSSGVEMVRWEHCWHHQNRSLDQPSKDRAILSLLNQLFLAVGLTTHSRPPTRPPRAPLAWTSDAPNAHHQPSLSSSPNLSKPAPVYETLHAQSDQPRAPLVAMRPSIATGSSASSSTSSTLLAGRVQNANAGWRFFDVRCKTKNGKHKKEQIFFKKTFLKKKSKNKLGNCFERKKVKKAKEVIKVKKSQKSRKGQQSENTRVRKSESQSNESEVKYGGGPSCSFGWRCFPLSLLCGGAAFPSSFCVVLLSSLFDRFYVWCRVVYLKNLRIQPQKHGPSRAQLAKFGESGSTSCSGEVPFLRSPLCSQKQMWMVLRSTSNPSCGWCCFLILLSDNLQSS